MKQFLLALTVLGSLVLTGCPAKTIERAEKSSAKLAGYANKGVEITRELFRADKLSLENKDKIADAFIRLADGGILFDKAVADLKAAYAGSTPPKDKLDMLFAAFNGQVVIRLLEVLQALKVLVNVTAWSVTIEGLKTAVILIARAFGRGAQVEARLQ